MKQSEILQALNLNAKNQIEKSYCSKLANLFVLIKELTDMKGMEVISENKGNLELVRAIPKIDYVKLNKWQIEQMENSVYNCKTVLGLFNEWQVITITFDKGKYSFPLPINNRFYYAVCDILGICYIKESEAKVESKISIEVSSEVLKAINKAFKFISKDEIRPAMTGVLLNCENSNLEVIGTDAHVLYKSPSYACNNPKTDFKVIISLESLKQVLKLKTGNKMIVIDIVDELNGYIDNLPVTFVDARYPDYKAVIPEYENYMTFDRKLMIDKVSNVIKSANKSTNQITFHLNGSIAMKSQDIDFNFSAESNIPYIEKTFPDTDIAFNGKFLINALNIFKDKQVKMYSEGQANRAGLISNDTDTVLIMPLMIHD